MFMLNRCNTPTSPAAVELAKDNSVSSALEARNKRMKKVDSGTWRHTRDLQRKSWLQTHAARHQFLFSGPGCLGGHHSASLGVEAAASSGPTPHTDLATDTEDPTARNFVVEKSLR